VNGNNEIEPFWRAIISSLLWVFLGSVLAVGITVLGLFGVQIPYWVALAVFVGGIVLALLKAAKGEYDKRVELARRLRPKLSISSGTKKEEDRWRIRVCNLTGATVRFGASLEGINPPIDYRVPARLQITGSPPPYRESDIPAEGEASVDVVQIQQQPLLLSEHLSKGPAQASQPPSALRIVMLSAEDPAGPVKIETKRYEITICVFPVQPSEGNAERRAFYIIPQPDGTVLLSDAGISMKPLSNQTG